jgi:hypothetical protein
LKILDPLSGMLLLFAISKAFLHHQQDLFLKIRSGIFKQYSEEIFHILAKKVDAIMKGQANVREGFKTLASLRKGPTTFELA